jgi:glycosyltransferase involved in cell wall biosynthesis
MTPEDVKNYLKENKIALLIPTYNNAQTLESVIAEAVQYSETIILVNDGSTDETDEILSRWKEKLQLVSYSTNKGKGNALKEGFLKAKALGIESVITLDSDGQHKFSDLPLFVEAHKEDPEAFIIGSRSFDNPNMPSGNNFANRFSNFWFHVQTLQKLPDTQTGYRLYPLKNIGFITPFNKRYEAELEILVRCAWKLVPLKPISIHVYYPPKEERVSHFRPGKDFFRISVLNTFLCLLAIVYGYPSMVIRWIVRKIKKLKK